MMILGILKRFEGWLIFCLLFLLLCKDYIPQLPLLIWSYDYNGIDANIINVINRIELGLPFYSDWRSGEIVNIYGPIHFFILLVFKNLITFNQIDSFVLARSLNFISALFTFVMCIKICLLLFRESRFKYILTFLCGYIFLLNSSLFLWELGDIRADFTLMFFISLGAYQLLRAPCSFKLLSFLSVLCFFTKQSGIILGVATILYYFFFYRRRILKFILWGLIWSIPLVLFLEIYNHGEFLLNYLVYVNKNYSGFLSWNYLYTVLKDYHIHFIWGIFLIPIGIYALFHDHRHYACSLAILFLVDLMLLLHIGRNTGACYYYYRFHWFLSSIISVYGLWFVFSKISNNLNKEKVAIIKLLLLSIILLKTVHTFKPNRIVKDYSNNLQRVNKSIEMAKEHQLKINKIIKEYPNARWLVGYNGSYHVKQNIILDQELVTVAYAIASRNFKYFNFREFKQKMLSGYYPLLAGYPPYLEEMVKNRTTKEDDKMTDTIGDIGKIISNCYRPILISKVPCYLFMDKNVQETAIHKYDGNRVECVQLKKMEM
ncbi:MAG: hypothetical protein HQK49_16825 [Oligoflexia bacterium]|nr:hypothetical protein [Oligoflexia bacterium]